MLKTVSPKIRPGDHIDPQTKNEKKTKKLDVHENHVFFLLLFLRGFAIPPQKLLFKLSPQKIYFNGVQPLLHAVLHTVPHSTI